MPPVQAAGPLHRVRQTSATTSRPWGGWPPLPIWRIPSALERAAQTAERGLLDAVLFADSPGLEIFRARYFPQVGFDPLELARRAGTVHHARRLIATASTTYSAPYDLARRGFLYHRPSIRRAGWLNIVTTRYAGAGNSSGSLRPCLTRTATPGPRTVEVVSRLWKAGTRTRWWRPGSRHMGRYGPDQADRLSRPLLRGQRRVDRCRGRRRDGPFAQAGSSGPGIELAGKTADPVHRAARRTVRAEFP